MRAIGAALYRRRRRRQGRGRRTPSAPCARPATTPRRRRPWASACSTRSPSPRAMRRRRTAWSGSRSSTGTSTTATARRRSSGPTRRCSTPRRTRCRSSPAPARRRRRAPATSSTRRSLPAKAPSSSRRRFRSASCRRCEKFAPDLILISAGFDAHHRDPLAEINLDAEDFAWATAELMEIADQSAGGTGRGAARRRLRPEGPGGLRGRPYPPADGGLRRRSWRTTRSPTWEPCPSRWR